MDWVVRISKKTRCLLCVLFSVYLMACVEDKKAGGGEMDDVEMVKVASSSKQNEVTVKKLQKGIFYHELVSNGKLVAKEYSDLFFRTTEVVTHIWVKNGDMVRKGQKIAELDLFKLNNALAQQKNALDQSQLEMKDVLIGQGYAPGQKNIPADVLELAKVKSGYEQHKALYESACHDVEQATLVAPFDGRVANLFVKSQNMAKTTEPFCRIINTAVMEVDFTILESELSLIKVGDKVDITPYALSAGLLREGRISEINPLVDEKGMVNVKAIVSGGGKLFDGMNVRVCVKRAVPNLLVVPKTAVVLRSGKQVVFTLKNGKAVWNYVHTGLENLEDCVIVDGLQEGVDVITTGNINLAHEAPVKLVK